MTEPVREYEQLRLIAQWQRRTMVAIGVSIVSFAVPMVVLAALDGHVNWSIFGTAWGIWAVIVLLGRGITCGYLADAVTKGSGWWGAIGCLPSLIGLLALAHVSGKATEALRAAGLRVGLFGAEIPPAEPV
jgi:hypothetical protein